MTAAAPVHEVEPAPAGPRRRRRRVRVVGAALVLLVGAGLVTAWWLGARSMPTPTAGGWSSADMEYATSEGLTEFHQVFRCAPGEVEARLDLASTGPVPATVTEVRVPLFDDLLGLDRRALRTGSQMMRDPQGELDDLVDFRPSEVAGSDWLRLVLTWEIRECPQLTNGWMIEDRVEVTYVALGMTHTVTVPLVSPMALTTMPLDDLP